MKRRNFTYWLSLSLAAAGGIALIVHVILTPLLPTQEGFVAVARSSAFLWRQSLSGVVAAFVMFGAAEILFRPGLHAPRWAGPAATLAVLGSAILIAQEWGEIFIIRTLASEAPDALMRMDTSPTTSAYDLGAMLALGAYSLGCIALVASALRTRGTKKVGPALVLSGFFLVPLLTAVFRSMIGGVVGNVVMDAGWILWGLQRYGDAQSRERSDATLISHSAGAGA